MLGQIPIIPCGKGAHIAGETKHLLPITSRGGGGAGTDGESRSGEHIFEPWLKTQLHNIGRGTAHHLKITVGHVRIALD